MEIKTVLQQSPLFEAWQDPVTGVTSYILIRRVAPIQQSFYFTNPSWSCSGRYYWFYCAFPPGGDAYFGRQLAVIDFENNQLHHFPETLFSDASPYVDPATGEVYWATGLEIWKRSPNPKDSAQRVASFPEELALQRKPFRLATHLSLCADKQSFAIDAQIGNDWFIGDLPLDGSSFRLWQKLDRCYNHAQFSPTDPDLLLAAQDFWNDPATGQKGEIEDRLWLFKRGEQGRPVFPHDPSPLRGHEWWDRDGQHLWYVRYHHGTEKVNIHTGKKTLVWPGEPIHSHNSEKNQYLTCDSAYSPEEWKVSFFNIHTQKAIDIASHLPKLPIPRSRYHIHPHPQFCLNDQCIAYTTSVLGQADVAFTPVADLIGKTS